MNKEKQLFETIKEELDIQVCAGYTGYEIVCKNKAKLLEKLNSFFSH